MLICPPPPATARDVPRSPAHAPPGTGHAISPARALLWQTQWASCAGVMLCEPDAIVQSEAAGKGDKPGKSPNDPLLTNQWALKAINAAGGWNKEAYGQV